MHSVISDLCESQDDHLSCRLRYKAPSYWPQREQNITQRPAITGLMETMLQLHLTLAHMNYTILDFDWLTAVSGGLMLQTDRKLIY